MSDRARAHAHAHVHATSGHFTRGTGMQQRGSERRSSREDDAKIHRRSRGNEEDAVQLNAHAEMVPEGTDADVEAGPATRTRQGKRLHSARVSSDKMDGGCIDNKRTEAPHEPSQKRSRSAQWPLPESKQPIKDASAAVQSKRSSPKASTRHSQGKQTQRSPRSPKTTRQARPSKFKEGSMNDRASAQPPMAFTRHHQNHKRSLGDENARERFEADTESEQSSRRQRARHFKSTVHLPRDVSLTESVRASREQPEGPSGGGVFRFGRSFAAVFNPLNIWNGWKNTSTTQASRGSLSPEKEQSRQSGQQRLRQQPSSTKDPFRDERKAKAEKAYVEMKQNGEFSKRVVKSETTVHKTPLHMEKELPPLPPAEQPHRDSGVDVDEQESQQLALAAQFNGQGVPPTSKSKTALTKEDITSPEINETPLAKFGLGRLKKVKSDIHISQSTTTPMPLRKQPSKRELQKQQRLSKRVSDLETKLQSARRELNEVIGEPVPPVPTIPPQGVISPPQHIASPPSNSQVYHRKPFVPGALACLPSERLLEGQDHEMADMTKIDASESARTPAQRTRKGRSTATRAEIDEAKSTKQSQPFLSKRASGLLRKRKSIANNMAEPVSTQAEAVSNESKEETKHSGAEETPRKAQKTAETDSPRSTAEKGRQRNENSTSKRHTQPPLKSSSTLAPVPASSAGRAGFLRFDTEDVPSHDEVARLGRVRALSRSPYRRNGRVRHARSTSPPPPSSSSRHLRSSSAQRSNVALPNNVPNGDLDPANNPADPNAFNGPNGPNGINGRTGRAGSVDDNDDPNGKIFVDSPVPPVPKMPQGFERIVRLASGEQAALPRGANVDPTKKDISRQAAQVAEDFEWPDDVF